MVDKFVSRVAWDGDWVGLRWNEMEIGQVVYAYREGWIGDQGRWNGCRIGLHKKDFIPFIYVSALIGKHILHKNPLRPHLNQGEIREKAWKWMLTIGNGYFSITFTMVLHRRQFVNSASLRGTKQSSRMSKDCFVVPPRNDVTLPPIPMTINFTIFNY